MGRGDLAGFLVVPGNCAVELLQKKGAKSVQDSKLRGVPVGLARHDFHAWKPISVF